METRANYVAVGAFVIVLLAGAAAVMIWIIGNQFNAKLAYFHMSFAGSVSGLTKDAAVRYNGVPVGKVTDIAIDKNNPNHISVIVALDPGTEIRRDAVSSLASQGLTGGSYIEISGGTSGSPPYVNDYQPPGPLIQSRTGGLQSIFDKAPEVMEKLLSIEDQIHDVLGGKNRASIDETVENIRKLSAVLASHSEQVGAILDNTADATQQVATLARSANQLIARTGNVVDHVDHAFQSFDTASTKVGSLAGKGDKLMDNLNGTVTDMRPGLRDLSQRGERQLEQLIVNANDFIIRVGRVVDELESNPSKFLLGDHNEGYKPR
jgi:phospholipid/cholesterol/gamma-HCH transport system substrate-binding protein